MQRAKVGLIGLAAVILLIGLASVIMRAVIRDRADATIGASQPGVVANMAMGNALDAGSEPLVDLGVSASNTNLASAPAR